MSDHEDINYESFLPKFTSSPPPPYSSNYSPISDDFMLSTSLDFMDIDFNNLSNLYDYAPEEDDSLGEIWNYNSTALQPHSSGFVHGGKPLSFMMRSPEPWLSSSSPSSSLSLSSSHSSSNVSLDDDEIRPETVAIEVYQQSQERIVNLEQALIDANERNQELTAELERTRLLQQQWHMQSLQQQEELNFYREYCKSISESMFP
ncbi:uncharacterized protein LOC123261356 [Cotesia glomerata]|uniref:Uncharacterized protein n=1 Tax=Cotesia glomerata TaxID=32391 RepID=A0AAV7HX99_COTGL|nr:uncharacterized protein LOC123261356 [Cotesia glomerata]KAH0549678.1 hypothetical protein KQX54_012270 [Cotesia glomerata]